MELKILKIQDRGTKDERIFIKILDDCNIGKFIVHDETFDEEGNKSNIWPHMYRFKHHDVKQGEYISLHIHQGKDRVGKTTQGNKCYIFYWGFDEDCSVFNSNSDTIHLIKIADETTTSV